MKDQTPPIDDGRSGLSTGTLPDEDLGSVLFRRRQRPVRPVERNPPPVSAAPLPAPANVSTSPRPTDFENAFRAAFDKAYADRPEMMPARWTVKELSMVKNAIISRWQGVDVLRFAEWVVHERDYLRQSHFSFMTRKPATVEPEVGFICRHYVTLSSAFNGDKRDLWLKSLDDREERRFRELTTKFGKTHEEARMILAEERATARLRKEISQANQNARSMMERAKQAEKRAQLPQTIHPESQTAKELRRLEDAQRREAEGIKPLGPDDPIPDLVAAFEEGYRGFDK